MTMEAFLPLYLSLVRTVLEFAIQAVSPYLQKDIDLTASPEADGSASEMSLAFPL